MPDLPDLPSYSPALQQKIQLGDLPSVNSSAFDLNQVVQITAMGLIALFIFFKLRKG